MIENSQDEIVVRRARAGDRNSILAFTKRTFQWGDYLHRAWDDWLRAQDGKLLVAEVEGKTVGNLHVAFVGEGEAWFEGMRVHPKFRKRGVAARLDAKARELSCAAGCRVVRLETASENLRAQSALERFGYRQVLCIREWESHSLNGWASSVRQARPADLNDLLTLWEHSWTRRATHALSPLGNPWHWGILTRSRLRAAVAQNRVWVTPGRGRARGFAEVSEDEDSFEVILVVGRAVEVDDILTDFRVMANERGQEKCYLMLPDKPRAAAWARRNGYKGGGGGVLLYQKTI